jgi:hypothetical protein
MEGSAAQHDRITRIALKLLPIATLAYLLVFAWRFADERLYADSGYYLARVINEGGFRIEHGRWVLAFSQLLPLVGAALGLGMKWLILLHSLNNVLWLGACVMIAWRWLRAPAAAVTLCALHLVGLTHGLFCPIFELYYGIDLLVLMASALRAAHLRPAIRLPLIAVLLFTVASSHLFGAVLAVGALALLQVWKERRLALVLVAVLIAQSVLHAATLTDYEKDHLSFLGKLTDPSALASAFAPLNLLEGLRYAIRHYPDALLLAGFSAFALFRSSKHREGLLFLGLLLAMAALVLLKLPGFLHDRYREQVNFALVAWVLITIGATAIAQPRWRSSFMLALIIATVYRMAEAERIAPYYAERTDLIRAEIAQTRSLGWSKAIVPAPVWFGPEHDAIDRSWSTSVESLLLSAKSGPDGTVSLITQQDLDFQEVRDGLDQFIFRRWDILDTSWLDGRWFSAPTGRYAPLPIVDAPGPAP